jgi:hypothetical protein
MILLRLQIRSALVLIYDNESLYQYELSSIHVQRVSMLYTRAIQLEDRWIIEVR